MRKLLCLALLLTGCASVAKLQVGQTAPDFELKRQDGVPFRLSEQRGREWTVLFFYPKAGTPGCTKQACAFRDSIKVITKRNASVWGISSDTQEAQAAFHREHKLTFNLLADPTVKGIELYGAKMPVVGYAKRWTFILDPQLQIRWIDENVDPVMDPQKVQLELERLQAKGS